MKLGAAGALKLGAGGGVMLGTGGRVMLGTAGGLKLGAGGGVKLGGVGGVKLGISGGVKLGAVGGLKPGIGGGPKLGAVGGLKPRGDCGPVPSPLPAGVDCASPVGVGLVGAGDAGSALPLGPVTFAGPWCGGAARWMFGTGFSPWPVDEDVAGFVVPAGFFAVEDAFGVALLLPAGGDCDEEPGSEPEHATSACTTAAVESAWMILEFMARPPFEAWPARPWSVPDGSPPTSSAFRRNVANGTNRRARIRDALTWRQ